MAIASFSDLLDEARQQPETQRLLFVFTRAELPDHPSKEQRQGFEQGEGGVLTPTLCVDKAPGELTDMKGLVAESRATGVEWDIAFVAAMADVGTERAEQQLDRMVEALKMGSIEAYLAFDREGDVVGFQ